MIRPCECVVGGLVEFKCDAQSIKMVEVLVRLMFEEERG